MKGKKDKFKLLILADDLTGALDSGVQLISKGLKVLVYTSPQEIKDLDTDVLVINTETRHRSPEKAFNIIYKLSKEALEKGFNYFYKKTDSGLRGNIGSELEAMLVATNSNILHFVPAYPKMNRITKNGIHYVNGKLLEESIFANDPINPLHTSNVEEIIRFQSDKVGGNGIVVHDCKSDKELQEIVKDLKDNNELNTCAGCAGFLEVYPICGNEYNRIDLKTISNNLIVVSGSANSITLEQLSDAEVHGAIRIHVPINSIINDDWDDVQKNVFLEKEIDSSRNELIIIDTISKSDIEITQDIANKITYSIGKIATLISKKYPDKLLMLIGGDALYCFIKELNIDELEPCEEIYPGTVLAKYEYENKEKYIVTKSGGFGEKDIFRKIIKIMKGE